MHCLLKEIILNIFCSLAVKQQLPWDGFKYICCRHQYTLSSQEYLRRYRQHLTTRCQHVMGNHNKKKTSMYSLVRTPKSTYQNSISPPTACEFWQECCLDYTEETWSFSADSQLRESERSLNCNGQVSPVASFDPSRHIPINPMASQCGLNQQAFPQHPILSAKTF